MHLKKQRSGALFIFLLITGMLISNCFAQQPAPATASGTPEDVLAEVGGDKITRAQYETELKTFLAIANPQAAAHFATPEGKKAFLTQITEILTLQKKAEQKGLNKGEKYDAAYHEMAVARLAAESMQQLVNAVDVKEEDVKAFYDKNKASFIDPVQYHVFQIAVDKAEKATEIKKQLAAGKSFIDLAKAESKDEFKASGGDKGFIAESALEPEILAAFSKLKKDEVSEPIKIDEDLHLLVKYADKKEGAEKEYSAVSAQIKRDLINNKQREVYEAEIEKLKKDMSFELVASAAESLRKETMTEEEKNAVLFKYAGKEVKVSELEEEMAQIPPFIRPQILGGEGLNDFLKQFYSRFLATENAEKSFAELSARFPEVVKDVARRTIIRFLLDEKLGTVVIADSDIEDFYKKNLAQFETPAQMKAAHILVKEEADAKAILATLEKEPVKFADLAREKSTCPSGKSSGGDLGQFGEGQMVAEFDAACKAAEIGKIVGPVKTQFGYHIIRVDEKNPAGTMKLEDVKEQIRSKLMPEKQKEVFGKFVDELKKEFNVILHQDKL